MTTQQLVDSTLVLSDIKRLTLEVTQGGLGLTVNELEQELIKMAPSAIIEVAAAYEWDFAIEESSTVTVANQASYVLKGESKNATNIASVRYSSTTQLLQKMTVVAMEKTLSRHTVNTPSFWTPDGRSDKYPKIKIISTPLESGTAITYKYWRSNVQLSEFSPVFDYLLTIALAKKMLPGLNRSIYPGVLADTIDMYDRGAGEVDVTVQDSAVINQNIRRSNMYGYGGTR